MNFSFLVDAEDPGQFVVPPFPYHPREVFFRISDWQECEAAQAVHGCLPSAGRLADELAKRFPAMPELYFRSMVSVIVKKTAQLPDGTRVMLQKQDGVYSFRVPETQKIIPFFDASKKQEV